MQELQGNVEKHPILNAVLADLKDLTISTKELAVEASINGALATAVASVYTSRHGANLATKAADACERGSKRMAQWILSRSR